MSTPTKSLARGLVKSELVHYTDTPTTRFMGSNWLASHDTYGFGTWDGRFVWEKYFWGSSTGEFWVEFWIAGDRIDNRKLEKFDVIMQQTEGRKASPFWRSKWTKIVWSEGNCFTFLLFSLENKKWKC